jgi:hypothetical protein
MTVGRLPNVEGGIQPTLLTTTGDIMYASSASNPARLGIGTASQILAVNSGATAPEWVAAPASGGMTLLSTTTLSGASTTISSINQTYVNLYILVTGVTNATSDNSFYCQPNAAATTSWIAGENSLFRIGSTDWHLTGDANHADRTSANNAYALTIYNYASTTAFKPIEWSAYYQGPTSTQRRIWGGGGFRSNTAVSSILFANSGGNLSTGTVLIYGVK